MTRGLVCKIWSSLVWLEGYRVLEAVVGHGFVGCVVSGHRVQRGNRKGHQGREHVTAK